MGSVIGTGAYYFNVLCVASRQRLVSWGVDPENTDLAMVFFSIFLAFLTFALSTLILRLVQWHKLQRLKNPQVEVQEPQPTSYELIDAHGITHLFECSSDLSSLLYVPPGSGRRFRCSSLEGDLRLMELRAVLEGAPVRRIGLGGMVETLNQLGSVADKVKVRHNLPLRRRSSSGVHRARSGSHRAAPPEDRDSGSQRSVPNSNKSVSSAAESPGEVKNPLTKLSEESSPERHSRRRHKQKQLLDAESASPSSRRSRSRSPRTSSLALSPDEEEDELNTTTPRNDPPKLDKVLRAAKAVGRMARAREKQQRASSPPRVAGSHWAKPRSAAWMVGRLRRMQEDVHPKALPTSETPPLLNPLQRVAKAAMAVGKMQRAVSAKRHAVAESNWSKLRSVTRAVGRLNSLGREATSTRSHSSPASPRTIPASPRATPASPQGPPLRSHSSPKVLPARGPSPSSPPASPSSSPSRMKVFSLVNANSLTRQNSAPQLPPNGHSTQTSSTHLPSNGHSNSLLQNETPVLRNQASGTHATNGVSKAFHRSTTTADRVPNLRLTGSYQSPQRSATPGVPSSRGSTPRSNTAWWDSPQRKQGTSTMSPIMAAKLKMQKNSQSQEFARPGARSRTPDKQISLKKTLSAGRIPAPPRDVRGLPRRK